MYLLVRELLNRFITFLLKISSGNTQEERLERVLRVLMIVTVLSLWGNLSLGLSNVYLKVELYDLEKAVLKLTTFFQKENNPLEEFIDMNKRLTTDVERLREKNETLYKDNVYLVSELKKYKDKETK